MAYDIQEGKKAHHNTPNLYLLAADKKCSRLLCVQIRCVVILGASWESRVSHWNLGKLWLLGGEACRARGKGILNKTLGTFFCLFVCLL